MDLGAEPAFIVIGAENPAGRRAGHLQEKGGEEDEAEKEDRRPVPSRVEIKKASDHQQQRQGDDRDEQSARERQHEQDQAHGVEPDVYVRQIVAAGAEQG